MDSIARHQVAACLCNANNGLSRAQFRSSNAKIGVTFYVKCSGAGVTGNIKPFSTA